MDVVDLFTKYKLDNYKAYYSNCFTLNYLEDKHAREVLYNYAYLIREEKPELSVELIYKLDQIEKKEKLESK